MSHERGNSPIVRELAAAAEAGKFQVTGADRN